MSSPDVETVRANLLEVASVYPDGYVGIARDARIRATDESLRLFATGKTKRPKFLGELALFLGSWRAPEGALLDAERALRAIQQAFDAQTKVVTLLRAGVTPDDAEAIAAADKPLPTRSAPRGAAPDSKGGRVAGG